MIVLSTLCDQHNVFIIFFFFFNDTATTEIYTLSLHDALPISPRSRGRPDRAPRSCRSRFASSCRERCHPPPTVPGAKALSRDRKSTRLNSSHANISYAVFCLKKKKKINKSYIFNHIFTNILYL